MSIQPKVIALGFFDGVHLGRFNEELCRLIEAL